MFTAAAKLIALLAFTVHAVCGCCVHHHHHVFTKACIEEHPLESCCHNHVCVTHETPLGSFAFSGRVLDNKISDQTHTDTPSDPCNGSHECKELSCSYMAASPYNSNDIESLTSFVVALGGWIRPTWSAPLSPSESCWQTEEAKPPTSSSLRCALAQSWQI